jgi:uncharacterized protein YbcI
MIIELKNAKETEKLMADGLLDIDKYVAYLTEAGQIVLRPTVMLGRRETFLIKQATKDDIAEMEKIWGNKLYKVVSISFREEIFS